MKKNTIQFTKTRKVKSPERANKGDAGIDFFIPEDFDACTLQPGEAVLIPAGIRAHIPHGYMLMAANKSGVATKKRLQCGAGIVDAGYEGEIHIHLNNIGTEPTDITPNMKAVQFIVVPVMDWAVEEINLTEYEEISVRQESTRGQGGFGSTGA